MSELFCDDGCGLSQRETLTLLKIEFPDNGPILVELSQEAANETARILTRKFEELAPKLLIKEV